MNDSDYEHEKPGKHQGLGWGQVSSDRAGLAINPPPSHPSPASEGRSLKVVPLNPVSISITSKAGQAKSYT
jgi:hypothetical protein